MKVINPIKVIEAWRLLRDLVNAFRQNYLAAPIICFIKSCAAFSRP